MFPLGNKKSLIFIFVTPSYLELRGAVNQYIKGIRLVFCVELNGPLRQYFSLYRAVSQREGERKEK